MASKQDGESLVYGIELTLTPEAIRRDDGFQIDFKDSLQCFLKGVFDYGGKVVLAFPDSTYAQVKGHTDKIRMAANSTTRGGQAGRASTGITICCAERGGEELDPDGEFLSDMNVEMVGVTITQLINIIQSIFRNLPSPRDPNVDVVMLLDPSETQALTVSTGEEGNPPAGQVYFESINQQVADAYYFFRVQFFSTQSGHETDYVTIWISFKTLLPVGITTNDELFAVLPESTLSPAAPLSTGIDEPPSTCMDESLSAAVDPPPPANTEPFYWLPDILNHPNTYFFREASMGVNVIVIHPANSSSDRRVIRAPQGEIAVVADNNTWEFTVQTQMS